jgi:hypothetical protein
MDGSALTLLEAGVFFVDHEQLAFAANDLAVGAAFLDGCTNFHGVAFSILIYTGS